ncbi:hypothetical protein evm_009897 [Chilo suppressalis]|nr:hypothetical protein evm_009897 [Chilo suppressalis]
MIINTLPTKYFLSLLRKRERSTSFSSLQECLEQPASHTVLWSNWFLLLLIAPPLYYFGFVQIWWQYDSESRLSSKQSFSPVTQKTLMPLPYYDEESTNLPYVRQSALPAYIRTAIQSAISSSNKVTTPWCRFRINKTDTVVRFGEMSSNQTYGKLVKLGGCHAPQLCRSRHKVAVIIPFRNRHINLAIFLFNIHPFLINQMLEYRIFVVEQSGKELFNKGRLFNVGYVEAMKLGKWDCMVFHDVDMLPMSKHIMYSCPVWPRHMCGTVVDSEKSVSTFHTFFGGVSSMSTKQFASVNGYSNLYWGWGGEDTDMFWRIRAAGFPMVRYQKDIAKYLSLPHDKMPECKNRNELVKTAIGRYSYDGLTTLSYRLLSIKLLHLYTHIFVDINPGSNNTTTAFRTVDIIH